MRARLTAALHLALRLALPVALLAASPAGAETLQARVTHPAEVRIGEAVTGQVSVDGPLQALEVALTRPGEGDLVVARGFPLQDGGAAGQRWAFLLGLPCTLKAGPYALRVRGAAGDAQFLHEGQVTVLAREFRTESIVFDGTLSSLMTSADPRRDREAAQLAEVLSAFREASVFHTGALSLPLQVVRRTSLYADRRTYRYVDGGSSLSLHNGVDLASPEGTPVAAAGSGRVVLCGPRLMSGNSVVLEHLPGVYSLYFHLRETAVQEGDLVAQGALIGTVGSTGLATGPHLHWELRVCGVAVDPEAFVERPLIDKTLDSGTLIDSVLR